MNFIVVIVSALVSSAFSNLDKPLNGDCTADDDCLNAYSFCNKDSRKCACIKGFTATNDGTCQSSGLACPTWNEMPNPQIGKPCEWHFNQTLGREVHTCDDSSQMCFIYPKVQKANGYLHYVGHCCPKPPKDMKSTLTVKCPMAVEDQSGTCPDLSNVPADMGVTGNLIRTCSYITHDCVHINGGKGACCPLPCTGASSHFSIDGKCYDTAMIDDPCTHTAQCAGNSVCVPTGTGRSSTCKCKGKTVSEPSPHCED